VNRRRSARAAFPNKPTTRRLGPGAQAAELAASRFREGHGSCPRCGICQQPICPDCCGEGERACNGVDGHDQ
jgi:hypothetical protein